MISVIVPVYNTEQYLPRCINSILSQTFTDFELLLIDDGSKDNSGKICDEYAAKDSRIRVFHKENGGATSARLLGVKKSIGEFICFVDSDDSMRKDALQILSSKRNGYDIIVANSGFDNIISGKDWIRYLLETHIRSEIWGVLYKRNILEDSISKIPQSIVIGEDLLINIICGLSTKELILIKDEIYHYRTDNNNSLVHSFRITLNHETRFIRFLHHLLQHDIKEYDYSVFRRKYLILERLVYNGEKPYKAEWVKELRADKKRFHQHIGFKEYLLLTNPSASINRCVLIGGIKIKSLARRIKVLLKQNRVCLQTS